jgi:phage-related protein
LPLDLRAKFERIVGLIKAKGLEQVREMRMSGRDGIARSIYVTATRKRIVILHTFIKKSDKTPRTALAIARARAKEVE